MNDKQLARRREDAARLLDLTLPIAAQGPRTLRARALIVEWLDGRIGYAPTVEQSMKWLRVALETARERGTV